jgi:hypothetical protein
MDNVDAIGHESPFASAAAHGIGEMKPLTLSAKVN